MNKDRSRYRILGQIGQGQFGRVYCAVHRQTGKIVALKDLGLQTFPTHRFLRELTYLVTLRHANIVSCQAIEHHQGGRYLVMEYCEGGTLRELMESESQLNLVCSLQIVADILRGLEHAHQHNIIHCDIKPENILLSLTEEGWTAKISDFGIARDREQFQPTVKEGGYTGSPAYMAPERFYGKYSPASDLYAVGVILYELVVGERPFSGLPGELLQAHLNQRLAVPQSVPPSLHSLINTALEKLPQKRFSCAREMLQVVLKRMTALSVQTPSQPILSTSVIASPLKEIEKVACQKLMTPVTHLAVESDRLYLGQKNQLSCLSISNLNLKQLWQVELEHPLIDLTLRHNGCYALTRSLSPQNEYSFYYFPYSNPEPRILASLKATQLTTAIAQDEHWLALCIQIERTTSAIFKILQLPTLRLVNSPTRWPFPSQLIALDRRHGLALFSPKLLKRKRTFFYLFNRRGWLIKGFSLPLVLSSVTANLNTPFQLLALEGSDRSRGVLINLSPFKVKRIALPLIANFIVASRWGYFLANTEGKILALSPEGNYLGYWELPMSITAIAPFAESGILIASWLDGQGSLYSISI